MTDNDHAEPTQKTCPKKGEPMEIPVPTRDEFFRDLRKVAPPDKPQRAQDEPADEPNERE
jgi:hypothetical protein